MSSSREDSPDWLRTFQAPTGSPLTLSSTSGSEDASRGASPSSDYRFGSQSLARSGVEGDEEDDDVVVVGVNGGDDPKKITQVKRAKRDRSVNVAAPSKREKKTEEEGSDGNTLGEDTSEKHTEAIHSIWALSSDSEICPDDEINHKKKREHKKSPRKHLEAEELTTEKETIIDVVQGKASIDTEVPKDTSEKNIGSRISTSRLPLVLSEKVHRSKALVECEGDSIDMSGDMGAVGRIVISDTSSGDNEMFFDLKGTIYRTSIVPSRTFCVVGFGQSEAKIEAIMNDFIQLKPQSNVYEAETMVEGTLEGFSFESDDEADKMQKAASHQNDQDEPQEDKANGKSKGKARKPSGPAPKKAKTGGGKSLPARKGRKKALVSKKSKAKK